MRRYAVAGPMVVRTETRWGEGSDRSRRNRKRPTLTTSSKKIEEVGHVERIVFAKPVQPVPLRPPILRLLAKGSLCSTENDKRMRLAHVRKYVVKVVQVGQALIFLGVAKGQPLGLILPRWPRWDRLAIIGQHPHHHHDNRFRNFAPSFPRSRRRPPAHPNRQTGPGDLP